MGISEKPVIALIALDDNVRLGILPHSNKFLKKGFTDKLTAAIEYKFRIGEILLIHPLLVHYGCAYKLGDNNLRGHFYFDNPELNKQVGPQGHRTYLFKRKVHPIPKNQHSAKAQQAEKDAKQVAKEASKKAKEACKRAKKASKVQKAAKKSVSIIRTRKQTQLTEQKGLRGLENSHNAKFD